jgi:hypothetical protein
MFSTKAPALAVAGWSVAAAVSSRLLISTLLLTIGSLPLPLPIQPITG